MEKLDIELVGIYTMALIESNPKAKKHYDQLMGQMIADFDSVVTEHHLPPKTLDDFMSADYASYFILMAFKAGRQFPVKRAKTIRPSNVKVAKILSAKFSQKLKI